MGIGNLGVFVDQGFVSGFNDEEFAAARCTAGDSDDVLFGVIRNRDNVIDEAVFVFSGFVGVEEFSGFSFVDLNEWAGLYGSSGFRVGAGGDELFAVCGPKK